MTTAARDATIRQTLIDMVNERVEAGDSPADASAATFGQLNGAMRKQFLAAYGPLMVYDLWRSRVRQDRQMPTTGERKVDPSRLRDPKSVLDALYEVNDEWISLGDLTKAQCDSLASGYAKSATGSARQMMFFSTLAETMNGEDIVRRRLTEEEVIAIRQRFDAWEMPRPANV